MQQAAAVRTLPEMGPMSLDLQIIVTGFAEAQCKVMQIWLLKLTIVHLVERLPA